jgi:serine/threonine protein kinase
MAVEESKDGLLDIAHYASIAEGTTASHIRSDYRRLGEIGRGRFGVVYLCQELATARVVAIKVTLLNTSSADTARKEAIKLLKLRSHPNIIHLHDLLIDDGPSPRIILVME